MPYRGLHYTNYQYITNSCTCVEFPHYFAWFVVCFPIATRLQSLYISFDLYCKCATFFCSRTSSLQCNEASRLIVLGSAFYRDRENVFLQMWNVCSALNIPSILQAWIQGKAYGRTCTPPLKFSKIRGLGDIYTFT